MSRATAAESAALAFGLAAIAMAVLSLWMPVFTFATLGFAWYSGRFWQLKGDTK